MKNIIKEMKNFISPPKIFGYFSEKPLGYISGHYEFLEGYSADLYVSRIYFYCPADRKLNPRDLMDVDYKIFNKKFVMCNHRTIFAQDETMTVEDARFYEDRYFDENLTETNPYEDSSWSGIDLYCIRCGSKLSELDENKEKGAWKYMRKTGVLQYYCSNKDCCHHTGMLTFHHPASEKTSAGESYSVSFLK